MNPQHTVLAVDHIAQRFEDVHAPGMRFDSGNYGVEELVGCPRRERRTFELKDHAFPKLSDCFLYCSTLREMPGASGFLVEVESPLVLLEDDIVAEAKYWIM
jgi:hypothetical protein